jgi:hypothetical protein
MLTQKMSRDFQKKFALLNPAIRILAPEFVPLSQKTPNIERCMPLHLPPAPFRRGAPPILESAQQKTLHGGMVFPFAKVAAFNILLSSD